MQRYVLLIMFLLAFALVSSPTLDGVITPSDGWNFIVANPDTQTQDFAGADIDSLFYYETRDSLYIAFTTQNRATWDVAYGIAFDTDKIPWSGYVSGGDAWGRHLVFGDGIDSTFCIDNEVYLWWSGSGHSITAWYFYKWDQNSASFVDTGFPTEDVAYTGDTLYGLQCVEMRLPLAKFGNPDSIRFVVYITGGDNSSAVDILPQNASVVFPATSGEWTDEDTIATFISLYGHEGVPETFSADGNVVFYIDGRLFIGGTGSVELSVSDVAGRILLTRRLDLGRNRAVDFDAPSGIYFVNIKSGTEAKTGKITILK